MITIDIKEERTPIVMSSMFANIVCMNFMYKKEDGMHDKIEVLVYFIGEGRTTPFFLAFKEDFDNWMQETGEGQSYEDRLHAEENQEEYYSVYFDHLHSIDQEKYLTKTVAA